MDLSASVVVGTDVLSLAAEHAAEAMVVIDDQQRILWLNHAAERLCGVQRRHVVGKALQDLVPPPLRPHFTPHGSRGRSRLDALLRYPGDILLKRTDGSRRWINLRAQSIQRGALRLLHLTDVQTLHTLEKRIELLSIGFDEAHAAVLITDAQGVIQHVNRGLRRLLGFSDGQLVGRKLSELLTLDPLLVRTHTLLQRLIAGQSVRDEVQVYSQSGNRMWCEVNAHPVHDPRRGIRHLVLVLTDITESRVHALLVNQLLEAMARETPTQEVMNLLCREVERIAPDVVASVIRVDDQGRLRPVASPSLPASYSARMDGVPIGPGVGACGTAAWSGKTVVCADIATDHHWDGIRQYALEQGLRACWSTPVIGKDGHILGTCAFYYRIPRQPDPFQRRLVDTCVHLCAVAFERDSARQRIHQLAYLDHLTGLPNRQQLMARTEQALAAVAHAHQSLVVLSVDLERFKEVNDMLGQQAGDILLRHLAQRMLSIVGPADIAGRLSGDEFVLVLTQCDAGRARLIAEQLATLVAEPFTLDGTVLTPRARIGISLYPDNGHTAADLLQRADLARVHGRKDEGRPLHFYSADLDREVVERRALEVRLRQALAEGGLSVRYQPQIALATGRLHGVEALSRWQDPERGEIPPSLFIPLAEEAGLISALGMYVLDQVCQAMCLWERSGLEVDSVSINLSPLDFRDPSLPGRVLARLEHHGLEPGKLTIEITEALVLDRHPDTLRCLRTLRNQGIRLALDDFGTGYSGFSYLRDLPVSEIKLDQSFVASMDSDPVSQALARAVAHIGQRTGMSLIAEGVTRASQADELHALGFTAVQGFHYAEAMTSTGLVEWLTQHSPAD